MAQSIDTMLLNASEKVILYRNNNIAMYELDKEFWSRENVTLDEKIAFYDMRDTMQAIMKNAIREAYKGLVQVAGLFGNKVDPKIKSNIDKIADELASYRAMVTFMFRQATKIDYKINSIWAY